MGTSTTALSGRSMLFDQFDHDRVELAVERALGVEKSYRKMRLFQQTVVVRCTAMRPLEVAEKRVQIRHFEQRLTPVATRCKTTTAIRTTR